ncbi:hypothetical protein JTB14_004204 [Gonioctena quinquepunctata]|nr:hypothetical protein JTB14_004204 [Gonioctena quinquepunctata]
MMKINGSHARKNFSSNCQQEAALNLQMKVTKNSDSNSDMDPMSDLGEAFDRRYNAAEEVISLPTFNGPRISNNSPQVSVSNNVLTLTKDDVNIGDWLIVHFPYFVNDRAQSTSKTFSRHYIAQVVKLIEDGYEGNFLREKTSSDYPGYVYTFLDVRDEYEFTVQHIVCKLNPPVKYGKGLLRFEIRVIEYNNKQLKYILLSHMYSLQ